MKFFAFLAAFSFHAFVIFADDDARTILLETKDAVIEGDARYDGGADFHCLRDWKSTNVVARWQVNIPAKGAYRVLLTYACPHPSAGSTIEVDVGTQRASGFTESTGSWQTFKEFDLGPVLLRKPGQTELSVKATYAAHGSVWDLRCVKLARED